MFGIQFASAYDVSQGRYSDYLPDSVPGFPYIGTVIIRNSYNMGCPPVRGDNPRALASGLSYVQVDNNGTTTTYISLDLAHHDMLVRVV